MRLLYTIWCAVCLVGLYLILFPVQFVFLQREAWKPLAHRVNAIWGRLFFALVGLPVRVNHGPTQSGRAVVHPPIETAGMTQNDVDRLKKETYRVIDTELMREKQTCKDWASPFQNLAGLA